MHNGDNVLEQLTSIPWSTLKHASGSAADVPDQLRLLLSADSGGREAAWLFLHEQVIREGVVYQVTSRVVPFLLELVASPATPERSRLLDYMLEVAQGQGWEVQRYSRSDSSTLQRRIAGLKRGGPAGLEQWGVAPDRVRRPESMERCLTALADGSSILCRLTNDEDPEIRRRAVLLLTWCPEGAAELARILEGTGDDATRAAALLALASVDPPKARQVAERELAQPDPALARLVAAYLSCARGWQPLIAQAGAVLLFHLQQPQAVDYSLLDARGDVFTELGSAMVKLPIPLRQEAAERLLEASLGAPTEASAARLCVALDLAIPQPVHRLAQLSELQRRVLEALSRLIWTQDQELSWSVSRPLLDELHARRLERLGRELVGYTGP